MVQGGATGAEGGEDGFAREPGEGGKQAQQEEAESRSIPGVARRAVAVATADGAGDKDGGGNAKRDGDGADEIKRGGSKADGGDEVRIVQAADKEDIDEINDEGGKDADAARQRHVDEVAPEVAGDKGGGGGGRGAVHEWCGLGKGADFSGFFVVFPGDCYAASVKLRIAPPCQPSVFNMVLFSSTAIAVSAANISIMAATHSTTIPIAMRKAKIKTAYSRFAGIDAVDYRQRGR